jgi:dynein heavy chain, axonemal
VYSLKNSKDQVVVELLQKDSQGRMSNALSTVLLQELDRYNKLLDVIRESLVSLNKAIRGLIAMSSDLEAVFASIMNNEVPLQWANVAYPSLKPLLEWTKDLRRRVQFLHDWTEKGQPRSFWLPGFFFPQGSRSFSDSVIDN